MKILTIHPGHNSNIAYFDNSECKLILHEEKLNNVKNYIGFPFLSLKYLDQKVNLNEVEKIGFGARYYLNFCSPYRDPNIFEGGRDVKGIENIYYFLGSKRFTKGILRGIRNFIIRELVSRKVTEKFYRWLNDNYKIEKEKVVFEDHHLLHALTPVLFYGLNKDGKKYLIFTMDGEGDGYFAKIFIYDSRNNQIIEVAKNPFDCSIGTLYSKVTKFLGMKPSEHEYKVMGLAAYQNEEKYFRNVYEKLKKVIWLDEKTLEFNSSFNVNTLELYLKKNLSFERFDNIASGLQKLTEDLVLRWIELTVEKYGIENIACSGGVFLNVKLNQKLMDLKGIKKIYFQPSCGDESNVIGSACKILMENNVKLKPIKTMFLGLEYSNKEIEGFLKKNDYFKKYHIEYFVDIEEQIAKTLSENKIVARFKGRGEWGSRSLCNRAILGNASRMETFYEVNDMIKMRDFWMPFAPTMLEEWGGRYIKNWKHLKAKIVESSKYMILAFDSTPEGQHDLKAAIHQKDKTLRPQIVEKKDNLDLYRLLKKYEEFTGMGGFLNTSLNLHGYPLVGTLEQALFTLENSGLKYIALENWLVSKK